MKLDPAVRVARARKAAEKCNENKKAASEERVLSGLWSELSRSERRQRILNEQSGCCAMCGVGEEWNDMPLKFELDHISGNRSDECRENLRLVCPNCHSQTPTYKTKNCASQGVIYTDEQIVDALLSSESVYKAIVKIGMNPHGGNYSRIRRIVAKYQLKLPYLLL